VLYEAPALNLFLSKQRRPDLESNIDNFEAIRVESSFKGNKLFLKRDISRTSRHLFVFARCSCSTWSHGPASPAYLRFMTSHMLQLLVGTGNVALYGCRLARRLSRSTAELIPEAAGIVDSSWFLNERRSKPITAVFLIGLQCATRRS